MVLFVLVQILFHSSLSASRSWCGIGMLASFVWSVFSFSSIPWCDRVQVITICLWSLVSSVYVSWTISVTSCFLMVLVFIVAFIEVKESV